MRVTCGRNFNSRREANETRRGLPMKPSRATSRRGLAPSLLATTSLAALLLGGTPALAGGLSFDGQTQASVTNPANTTITSIVINNSTVTGAVTNAGTISPGKAGAGFNGATVALAVTNNKQLVSRLTLQVTPQRKHVRSTRRTLNLAPQGSLFAFGASRTYRDVFVADATLSGRLRRASPRRQAASSRRASRPTPRRRTRSMRRSP